MSKEINVFIAPQAFRNLVAFAAGHSAAMELDGYKISIGYANGSEVYGNLIQRLEEGMEAPGNVTMLLDHTEFPFTGTNLTTSIEGKASHVHLRQPHFNKVSQYSRMRWRGINRKSFPLMRELPILEVNAATELVNGKAYVARLASSSMTRGMFKFVAAPHTSIQGVAAAITSRNRGGISIEEALRRCKAYGAELYPNYFEAKNMPKAATVSTELILTEYQPDIKGEYRFFTDIFGEVNLIMKRERAESNGAMLTPINGIDLFFTKEEFIKAYSEKLYAEICKAIAQIDIPLCGFDIFTAGDEVTNWGMFEYGPGYAMGELPHSYARQTYLGGIVELAKKTVKLRAELLEPATPPRQTTRKATK